LAVAVLAGMGARYVWSHVHHTSQPWPANSVVGEFRNKADGGRTEQVKLGVQLLGTYGSDTDAGRAAHALNPNVPHAIVSLNDDMGYEDPTQWKVYAISPNVAHDQAKWHNLSASEANMDWASDPIVAHVEVQSGDKLYGSESGWGITSPVTKSLGR
jgi:hypothetical protein